MLISTTYSKIVEIGETPPFLNNCQNRYSLFMNKFDRFIRFSLFVVRIKYAQFWFLSLMEIGVSLLPILLVYPLWLTIKPTISWIYNSTIHSTIHVYVESTIALFIFIRETSLTHLNNLAFLYCRLWSHCLLEELFYWHKNFSNRVETYKYRTWFFVFIVN